ncbi:hypothetical protein ACP26L_16675 [Paenibacillus sp. S-38]|uniref:hypothetical protein n=1 Tax=Paenibacillus sp. S-38 TaxID=3416710 RepID=UPI003CF4111B
MRNELLMNIFVSEERHIPHLVSYLEEELEASQRLSAMLAGIKAMVQPKEDHQTRLWLLTPDYGEKYVRMTGEWCQHALNMLTDANWKQGNE